jgi:hypothetical protein
MQNSRNQREKTRTVRLLSLLTALTMSSLVSAPMGQAQTLFQSAEEVSIYVPYTKWMNKGNKAQQRALREVINISTNYVRDFVKNKAWPEEVATFEEAQQKDQSDRGVEVLLAYLDTRIAKESKAMAAKKGIELDRWSVVPDAYFAYVGVRFAESVKVVGKMSLTMGLVMMPMHITSINKITGKRTERFDCFVDVIYIATPEIGANSGVNPTDAVPAAKLLTGWGSRFGIGAIWGGRDFLVPSQVKGAGVGWDLTGSLGALPGQTISARASFNIGVNFADRSKSIPLFIGSVGFDRSFMKAVDTPGKISGTLTSTFILSSAEILDFAKDMLGVTLFEAELAAIRRAAIRALTNGQDPGGGFIRIPPPPGGGFQIPGPPIMIPPMSADYVKAFQYKPYMESLRMKGLLPPEVKSDSSTTIQPKGTAQPSGNSQKPKSGKP